MASYTYELAELGDEAYGLGCKCCRFKEGTDLPIPKKLDTDEIKQHALQFSTSILKDWTKLNAILKRFEGTIQKRWLKKSAKQKRDILLQACPVIPAEHRPDFEGFRKLKNAGRAPRSRTCPSQAYLWPYINLEDLQQGHLLPLFLNSRGRHLPERFLSADVEAAHLGKGWAAEPPKDGEFAKFVIMTFFHQRTPRTYGGPVEFGGSPNVKRIDGGKMLSVPTTEGEFRNGSIRYHATLGLLGLEIQAGVYDFLLRCAKLILHDVDPSQYFLAAHQPAPPPLTMRRAKEYVTLQDHMLEAPYKVPQGMDLDRLKSLVAARRSSAEDHIWLLKEDPSYFVETMKEWKEHDEHELSHKCSGGKTCPGAWPFVAARVVADAFDYLLYWHRVWRLISWMPSIESQLARADHTSMKLPSREEVVWATLDKVINTMLFIPLDRLTTGMPVSPRMRHCFPYIKDPKATVVERWYHKRSCSETELRVHRVFYSIVNPELRGMHALHHLVEEAQYMIDTEPAASQLVDPWLASHFADLALISELRLSIDKFEPWSKTWKASGGPQSTKAVVESVEKLLALDEDLNRAIYDACYKFGSTLETFEKDMKACWSYPVDKRATKENVDQMRHAESHLDMFWIEVEELVFEVSGKDMHKILQDRTLQKRKIHRTPKWKEPVISTPAQTPSISQTPGALRDLDVNKQPKLNGTSEPCTSDLKPKVKVKTRGKPTRTIAEFVDSQQTTSAREPIKVSKRTFKTFNALLPDATADQHQRTEMPWDDLLHAMDSIGLEPEKLYGSVWSFKPTAECKVEVTRGILFHEPKEVRRGHKIPSQMVRVFGRRLKHAFGWEAGMFVCE